VGGDQTLECSHSSEPMYDVERASSRPAQDGANALAELEDGASIVTHRVGSSICPWLRNRKLRTDGAERRPSEDGRAGAALWFLRTYLPVVFLADRSGVRDVTSLLDCRAAPAISLAELDRHSGIDALTGQYNRRHLEEELARRHGDARRHRSPLGLLRLDVDHFKHVNDTIAIRRVTPWSPHLPNVYGMTFAPLRDRTSRFVRRTPPRCLGVTFADSLITLVQGPQSFRN
jgi:hypothetical protein